MPERSLLNHTVRIPASARSAAPYTISELDALPEPYRSRFWATIEFIRQDRHEAIHSYEENGVEQL
jgi:hypothetical protein